MTSAAIVAQYKHARAELKEAKRKLAACKNSKKLLARRNQVATWEHVVRELEKRYGFGTKKEKQNV